MGAAGNKRAAPTSSGAAAKRAKPGGAPPRPNTKHAGQGKPPAAKLEKLGRKERKELERARKMRRNKNFGLIEEVVALWEEARRHDVTPAKRSKLVAAILGKVQGHVAELAGSHSASRVIQTCAKYGTAEERASILRELEPKLLELSKSPYGHFVVSKLVALAPKQQLPGLLKAFRGHLGELLRHPAGSHARPPTCLTSCRVDGAKQRSIIQHMSKDLIPIMEKGLVDCPLVHRLVSEFMEFSPASVVADAADNLCGDPLLHMEGVKAVCMALAYGTAKDRKKALKCMKGHVDAMARDEWGHLALITALSVVDDTTLLRKTVIVDLQKDLAELAEHRYSYRVLMQLLHPDCGRYLPPQLAAIARPPAKHYSEEAMRRPQHEVEAAARQQEPAAEAGGGGGDDSDEEEQRRRLAEEEPTLSHFFGSRALRRLVLASGDGGAAGAAAAAFAAKLWSGALQGQCSGWVDSHAAKVLAAVAQCGDAAVRATAAKELQPLVQGSVERWAAKLTAKQPPGGAARQQPKRPAAAGAGSLAVQQQRQAAAASKKKKAGQGN
ncbi:pumilio-like protein 24 [Micractinium conductrix]|uniref:Pumilio-like protein 24 n=1 Tax=Micractinium conductrix TaxID=554055 RepID=A0A2P6UYT8_9CHLO|nr:pumilio-like protein 24 [Micractinium conductrix]|eukprot:PSC67012.1 pumilio-like protein 24 [Micractinium conductrix]